MQRGNGECVTQPELRSGQGRLTPCSKSARHGGALLRSSAACKLPPSRAGHRQPTSWNSAATLWGTR